MVEIASEQLEENISGENTCTSAGNLIIENTIPEEEGEEIVDRQLVPITGNLPIIPEITKQKYHCSGDYATVWDTASLTSTSSSSYAEIAEITELAEIAAIAALADLFQDQVSFSN